MSFLDRLIPGRRDRRQRRELAQQQLRFFSRLGAITAANGGGGGRGGRGGWVGMPAEEDSANKQYAQDLGAVIQRAQDLDVNNPDIGGFNRTRVAQLLGSGVKFMHAPRASEIEVEPADAVAITEQVDRLREIHSRRGGFDSTGNNRSEGKQQERAMLTALIHGACLIHRVWREDGDDRQLLPFSIELIPGSRITTPYSRLGDPLVSYGVQYSDDHRTRVVGYHVRRVSKTIGNSYVPDYEWDFIPVEDAALLSLTEQAGLDRAMPHCTRITRMARNRGEWIESAVESARAQAKHYGVTEGAPGQSPFDMAADDAAGAGNPADGQLLTELGDGVRMLYNLNGQKTTWSASKLPDPDFSGFMDKTDERMARGLVCSLSRFTRKVNSSWAGGRMEDQQDDPVIDQLRESFLNAWHRVNEWWLEALWLTDAIELPGYGPATRPYWTEFRATFPGKVHINPTDTMTAREKGMMLRSVTPQEAAEEDGGTFPNKLDQWADALLLIERKEKEKKLPPGSLSILFSGKAITTAAGVEVAPPDPEKAPDPTEPGAQSGAGSQGAASSGS